MLMITWLPQLNSCRWGWMNERKIVVVCRRLFIIKQFLLFHIITTITIWSFSYYSFNHLLFSSNEMIILYRFFKMNGCILFVLFVCLNCIHCYSSSSSIQFNHHLLQIISNNEFSYFHFTLSPSFCLTIWLIDLMFLLLLLLLFEWIEWFNN
jgi:hypothetical protein